MRQGRGPVGSRPSLPEGTDPHVRPSPRLPALRGRSWRKPSPSWTAPVSDVRIESGPCPPAWLGEASASLAGHADQGSDSLGFPGREPHGARTGGGLATRSGAPAPILNPGTTGGPASPRAVPGRVRCTTGRAAHLWRPTSRGPGAARQDEHAWSCGTRRARGRARGPRGCQPGAARVRG